MIQVQLKLKLTPRQERQLARWLYHLTAVWNWSLRKVELDNRCSRFNLINLLAGHSKRMKIPAQVMGAIASEARQSWERCFKGLTRKPRFKGRGNRLRGIPFSDGLMFRQWPNRRISVLGVGRVRYHKQAIPDGKIKCGRIVKRASGWYLCLFIDAKPNAIPRIANGQIGIDPGFSHLLTLSTGEKTGHPRELEASALRLAQAQRGHNRRLTARLNERIANQRKDRNHKLSRRLVSENSLIAFSADNHKEIARRFGKSVASSGHGQLRSMLAYKSSSCGTRYVEVNPKHSTMRCSGCGELSGPTGLRNLAVRQWRCTCGAQHDRDVNAAINTLHAALGMSVDTLAKVA